MSNKLHKKIAFVLAICFALVTTVVVVGLVVSHLSEQVIGESSSRSTESARQYVDRQTDTDDGAERRDADRRREAIEPTGEDVDLLEDYPDKGGEVVARTPDGEEAHLPMLEADYEVDIRGDLATVTVEQRFENPGEVPLDATYRMPMSEDAAVFEMQMRVGDELIRGVVQEKQEARETYEKAKSEGKAASLIEEDRPNLFTEKIANLMPGQPVDITLRYVETVEKVDGAYQLVVPFVVGPRYEPADMSGNELVESEGGEETQPTGDGDDQEAMLPPISELDAPDTIDEERVSLDVRIDGGVPVRNIESPTHALSTRELDPKNWQVGLAEGRTIANKHFVLDYDLRGDKTDAGLLAEWNEEFGEGYFSLLIEPPAELSDDEIVPREMVFLLDASGSMRGKAMESSRSYMRRALEDLRPTDTFRIVRFGDEAHEFSEEPREATDENIEEALAYVNDVRASGGTEMVPGFEQALEPEVPDDAVRFISFLSDGNVRNEYEVIRLLGEELGDGRVFSIGVGSGVNRFLLEEVARVGRGFSRYIDPNEYDSDEIKAEARRVAEKLERPVLTDIDIDWGALDPRGVTPQKPGDLFDGESIRVAGRYQQPGEHTIEVRGRSGAQEVSIPIEVELPDESTDGKGVELTWAQSKIDEYMHTLTTPKQLRSTELDDDQIKEIVTQMGLDHSLATKWTSFVAVSEKVVNENPEENAEGQVPESKVDGMTEKGYGKRAPGTPRFKSSQASGVPEPTTLGGLLLAAIAGAGALRRRRRDD